MALTKVSPNKVAIIKLLKETIELNYKTVQSKTSVMNDDIMIIFELHCFINIAEHCIFTNM